MSGNDGKQKKGSLTEGCRKSYGCVICVFNAIELIDLASGSIFPSQKLGISRALKKNL